jgi:hypothetical protein
MVGKGGRRSTTWTGGSWQHGDTKTIRVPIALEAKIMAYARKLDGANAVSHGNEADIILNAIANYTKLRKTSRHNNQHSKELDTTARTWDELRKFAKLVEEQPELLGLPNE